MPDGAIKEIRAASIGPIAARVLREGARGTVRGVFQRSFYVAMDGGWVCAGATDLGDGPLNVVCELWFAGSSLTASVREGNGARVESGHLLAGTVAIRVAAAQPWHPAPPGAWSTASLARGLAAFDAALPAALPEEGLARLLRNMQTGTRVLTIARPAARYLAQVLRACIGGDTPGIEAERLAPLIGLGPGLTPSGDDYLGGALVALSLTAQTRLRDRVWGVLQPRLAGNTGDISRAHLAAAAEGFGHAALHGLLAAILTGAAEAIAERIAAVAAIGHTSGWDAMAGAIAALRATCTQPSSASVAICYD